jgi:hypothetical protein
MPYTDLTNLTKDADRFGINLARTIRVIAKLLLDWSVAERTRKENKMTMDGDEIRHRPNKPLPPLTAIYFDKLAMFYCRLWNRLHDDSQVRYRAAFTQKRGIHGPGQALKIDRQADKSIGMGKNYGDYRRNNWAFTMEVAEKLKPGISNAQILFRLDGAAWSADCKVYPQLEENVWDSWCCLGKDENDEVLFLNQKEQTLMIAISSAIASLPREELRAIGTHSSADETCKDIEFNLNMFETDFDFILKVMQGSSMQDIEASAYRLVTTAREVKKKSIDNRKVYENAYKILTNNLATHPVILNTFIKVQYDANHIWQNERIKKYANIAPVLLEFSVYCRRILFILGKIAKLKPKEIKESDELLNSFKAWSQGKGISLFDYTMVKSTIESEVASKLQVLKEKIMLEMPGNEDLEEIGIF